MRPRANHLDQSLELEMMQTRQPIQAAGFGTLVMMG